MKILGINCNLKREDEEHANHLHHDAAAVLLRDGTLVCAYEEERICRLKHANVFPAGAIGRCLDHAGVTFDEIDCIAVNGNEAAFSHIATAEWFADAASGAQNGRAAIANCFSRAFDVDIGVKLTFCRHHRAHAWSAFVPSGFDESLICTADGQGDNLSGMILTGNGRRLTVLRENAVVNSLGILYQAVIALIGYHNFDEYKAMGLAPYGDRHAFESLFARNYRLLERGGYEIAPFQQWLGEFKSTGLFARARQKTAPFTQEHKDLAAALQAMLEHIVLHMLSYYRQSTGNRNLCLAGGVFHNCSLNGAVLYSGLFDKVFVQPASHDAGGAYGAAVEAAVEHGEQLDRRRWNHLYFGTDIASGDELEASLEQWRDFVEIERLDDAAERAAQLLAGGSVIGWVQGRAEFGPRALGDRSILADPRPASNKDRINSMVKKREEFRPFAPAVLVERLRDYFEVPGDYEEFPFMIFVLRVRPECRALLGATTHVDGTARVQTVSQQANTRFWNLIRAFETRTGVPILLNTSFNNNAEPIVDSPDEAIGCYLTTGLDVVIVGDYLLRRKAARIPDESFARLAPRLPVHERLVSAQRLNLETRTYVRTYVIQSTRPPPSGLPTALVSRAVYRVLELADGRRSVADLSGDAIVAAADRPALYAELQQLWARRVVTFSPPR
jgi:carbamoyltransferase